MWRSYVLFQGVSPDSLIDVGVQIGEKVNVKKSCIGQHCFIGEKSKIINCILMDHVTVGEGWAVVTCNAMSVSANQLLTALFPHIGVLFKTVLCAVMQELKKE